VADYRDRDTDALRVLFCLGVSQTFFEQESERLPELIPAIKDAFADLRGRFGVQVLGTLDDDELMVGPSPTWPWTAYILADVPDLAAATAVCNIVRETPVGEHRLWRYLRIEARVGRRLFFGNE
jgi:hypothetical protein